ncbi:ferrous-iron efflux pump FieF [Stella humosa]|uniref:Cation-efflux pump FieF n=1 Tax=Stella humosa TaxID=94 RepID=A0A3N1KHP1_9PROT|nr:cation diffusion facilitator family transporter [Stella humosa]ROP81093.1 ferrous-iron efflux pump FieF [Stella humosa]BBK29783.1 iron transporter [Stella humosa]
MTAAAVRDPAITARLLRRAVIASTAVAASLILVKTVAYIATDSVSLLSSLIDSLLDLAASLVNMLAVRHALTPADDEHRFGHGKAEPLAGLAQAGFIAGSAVLLFVEAARRLAAPEPVTNTGVGVAVMVFSILASLALVTYQRHVVRRTGSVAIGADSLHYQSDLLLNGAVIVSLLASRWLTLPWLDPLFGIAIGAFILWSALQIVRLSTTQLMDRELPDAEREQIRAIALAHPDVRDVHDLKTRAAGPQAFVQIHIELDGDMTLRRAHAIADAVEAAIRHEFPHAEVIIHQDPAGLERHGLG